MITGRKKIEIDRDYILSKIDEYDIYHMYIPNLKLNKSMKSPFRQEKTSSFLVGVKGDNLCHKDMGNSNFRGDCFSLVQQLFNLTWGECLLKIAQDFGIKEGSDNHKAIVSSYPKPKITNKYVSIDVESKLFSKEHLDYLAQYSLEPKDLNFGRDINVVAVKRWRLNKEYQGLKRNEIVFGYNINKWWKIYRPTAEKGSKWVSNVPFSQMIGISNMLNCEIGIISKSVKDCAWISKYITSNVCCVQAEDYAAINEENIKLLSSSCNQIYVNFDNDKKGQQASREITKHTGWKYINVPNHLLEEGITDISDWVKAYGTQVVIDYFKSKNII